MRRLLSIAVVVLAAAVVEGQETVDAQTGGFADLKPGGGGGAKGVLGQNAAVSGAELDHQFLFVVVCHESDVHVVSQSFLM